MQHKKIAVVLLNLGGPLKRADIKPFLFNFFMDKNIIGAPLPVRYFLARYISAQRGEGAALESYGRLGYVSPLLENTQSQADALQDILPAGMRVFISMRYWHPRADAVVQAIKKWGADEVVLLPLYPQYSTTTVKSSFEDFARAAEDAGLGIPVHRPVHRVESYHLNTGFIRASAACVRAALSEAPENTRVLFSAHGLPEKVIRRGDPYQKQCEETAAAIAQAAGLSRDNWRICYQSRIGPLKWIGPSIAAEIEQAARDGMGVVVYPHAFVSEHVETLVELDIEYRHLAEKRGVPYYGRAQTVGTHPEFIGALADLALRAAGVQHATETQDTTDTQDGEKACRMC